MLRSLKMVPLLLIVCACYAFPGELRDDLTLIIMKNNEFERAEHAELKKDGKKQFGELSFACRSLIKLYQTFISPQDLPACSFTKSCSRFGLESFEKYGPIHGLLMTSDRLQRCNGFARGYYRIDRSSGLAVDYPVERYHLD